MNFLSNGTRWLKNLRAQLKHVDALVDKQEIPIYSQNFITEYSLSNINLQGTDLFP